VYLLVAVAAEPPYLSPRPRRYQAALPGTHLSDSEGWCGRAL